MAKELKYRMNPKFDDYTPAMFDDLFEKAGKKNQTLEKVDEVKEDIPLWKIKQLNIFTNWSQTKIETDPVFFDHFMILQVRAISRLLAKIKLFTQALGKGSLPAETKFKELSHALELVENVKKLINKNIAEHDPSLLTMEENYKMKRLTVAFNQYHELKNQESDVRKEILAQKREIDKAN